MEVFNKGQITVASVDDAVVSELNLLPSVGISQEYTEETEVYLPDYTQTNLTIVPSLSGNPDDEIDSISYTANGKTITSTSSGDGIYLNGNNLKVSQNIGELDLGQVSTSDMTNKFLALESEMLPIVEAEGEIPAPANLLSTLGAFNEAKYSVMQDIGIGNLLGADADEFNGWTGGTLSNGVFSIVTPTSVYKASAYSGYLAPLEAGATYTIGFWAKDDAEVAYINEVYLISTNHVTNSAVVYAKFLPTNEWAYYTLQFVIDSDFEGVTDVRVRFANLTRSSSDPALTSDVTLQIKDVRLTQGVQPESANLLDKSAEFSGTGSSYIFFIYNNGNSLPVLPGESCTYALTNSGSNPIRGFLGIKTEDGENVKDLYSADIAEGERVAVTYTNTSSSTVYVKYTGLGNATTSSVVGDYDVKELILTKSSTAYSWRPSINDEETLIEDSESTVTSAVANDVISTTERDEIIPLWNQIKTSYTAWVEASKIFENVINIKASAVIDSNTAPLEATIALSMTKDVGSVPQTMILAPNGTILKKFNEVLPLYAKMQYGSYEQVNSDSQPNNVTYTWYRNDTTIIGRSESVSILASSLSGRTKITCRTVSRKGRSSEKSIEVYPRLKGYTTEISTSKSEVVSSKSSSQTLKAELFYFGTKLTDAEMDGLSYQWYKLNDSNDYIALQGKTSRTLEISPNAEIESYQVTISN